MNKVHEDTARAVIRKAILDMTPGTQFTMQSLAPLIRDKSTDPKSTIYRVVRFSRLTECVRKSARGNGGRQKPAIYQRKEASNAIGKG